MYIDINYQTAAELLENQEFVSTLMNRELDHAQAALLDMEIDGDEGTIQDLIDQVNYNSYSYYSPGFEQTLAQMESLSRKLKSYLTSLDQ